MKTRMLPGILVVLAFNASSSLGAPVDGPKIAGHLKAYTTKAICWSAADKPPCNAGETHLTTHGNLNTSYNLYLVVLDGNAVAGVSGAVFGIEYNGTPGAGMDLYSWIMCAGVEYSGGPAGVSWPASGSGNAIVWDRSSNCQRTSAAGDTDSGVTAVLGAFYVYAYSEDLFSLTKRNYAPSPDLSVGTCDADEITLDFPNAVGKVGFGTTQGVDPCH